MSAFEWFLVVQGCVNTCGILVALIWRAGAKGQALVDKPEQLAYRIEQLEKRVDQTGHKISDLATAVQGLPEHLRTTFVPREVYESAMSDIARRADRS